MIVELDLSASSADVSVYMDTDYENKMAVRRVALAQFRIAHRIKANSHFRDWPSWLIVQRFKQANENKIKKQNSVSEHSAGPTDGE